MQAIIDFLTYLPRVIFKAFLDSILYLINNLPFTDDVIAMCQQAKQSYASFSPLTHEVLHLMAFSEGMGIITMCLLIRFAIKLFPTVG
jgi:hypothetical protein